jgi:competence protein ComEC
METAKIQSGITCHFRKMTLPLPSRIIVFLANAITLLGAILMISLTTGGCSPIATKGNRQEEVRIGQAEEIATDIAGDPVEPPEELPLLQDVPPIEKDEGIAPPEPADTGDLPQDEGPVDSSSLLETTDTKEDPPPPPDDYNVFFINVGQGDSILIKTNQGHYVLIDAGPPDKENTVNAFLTAEGVSKLEAIILSHPHQDHYGEMPDVLDLFPVDSFIYADYPNTNAAYQKVLDTLDTLGVPRMVTKEGESSEFDNLRFAFFHPPLSGFVTSPTGENDNSLTIKICNVSLLCLLAGGDLETKGTNTLLAGHSTEVDVELLKVNHHGSSTGTTQSLLDATSPTAAFILVGPNGYKHPSPGTLQLLEDNGIATYRTDITGNIGVWVTSSTYSVTTEN